MKQMECFISVRFPATDNAGCSFSIFFATLIDWYCIGIIQASRHLRGVRRLKSTTMLLNYLKLSLRLLARNPFFTFINVAGLAVGFSVFIFLWQYSQNEMQSDRMWKDWRRIARVGFHTSSSEGEIVFGGNPTGITPLLKQDFPEIEEFTRAAWIDPVFVTTVKNHQKVIFKEEEVAYADANFFKFFDIPFVYGQAEKSLADGNSVSISHSTALKYFGERNPLGEILIFNDTLPLKVTGIYTDFPANSHLPFDIVISNEKQLSNWAEVNMFPLVASYVKTRVIVDWAGFEEKLNESKEKYWQEIMQKFKPSQLERMLLHPLPEVMFISAAFDTINPTEQKSRLMVILFGTIGLVVLIIAWINYIILNMARAKRRMKEIATRKVAGASFKDIARQFIIESLLLNAISVAFGFTLLQVIRKSGNLFFGMPLYDFSTTDGWNVFILVSIFITGIVTTGLYPALVAARYHPRELFNIYTGGGFSKSGRMITLLTTAQFTSAIILILWAFMVYLQLDHVITKSLENVGDAVVVIDAPIIRSDTYLADLENFADRLGAIAGVTERAIVRRVLGDNSSDPGIKVYPAGSELGYFFESSGGVDENFIPFFNIKILAGRNFVVTDKANVIILSERALQRMGFTSPLEAIGAMVKVEKSTGLDLEPILVDMEVIGVIKDYQLSEYFSNPAIDEPENGIGLVFKGYHALWPQRVIIKVEPQNVQTVLSTAEEHFQSIFPGSVFNWYWLDEHVARHYDREKTNRNQISVFTLIAIGIACLGLLGIISNKVIEKTKEIGIRKILGAELSQIAQFLLNTTVKQIAVATLIGIPVAFYLAQKYLEKYTERIVLEWWHFALPVLILIVILFATIASVLWKAARSNPVEALKYE